MIQLDAAAQTTVFVAEFLTHLRLGVCTHLDSFEWIKVVPPMRVWVKQASQLYLSEALKLVSAHHPDVVVMGIRWGLDDFAGVNASRQIKQKHPGIKIIMSAMQVDRGGVEQAVLNGLVDGFVSAETASTNLPEAIKSVAIRKVPYFPPNLVELLLKIIRDPGQNVDDIPLSDRLTNREIEILRCIAQGETDTVIRARLGFKSDQAVRAKNQVIYQKLGVYNIAPEVENPRKVINLRVMAIILGLQRGYLRYSDLIPSNFASVIQS